jgi:hypothetical protein
LIVKSRRAASSRQSLEKATVARRPSVETSRRSVVISIGPPASTAVTVPCAMPVGITLIPACCSRRIASSGASGVAISISLTAMPMIVSRTAPPT